MTDYSKMTKKDLITICNGHKESIQGLEADLAHAMGVIDAREGEVEELQDRSFEARDRIEHLEAALAGAQQTRDALTGVLTMVWGQMVERERP